MKQLLTGNEAVARGLYEAGCTVAAAYPGTPSTEVLENVAKYKEIKSRWTPNEKVAVEVAGSASMAGARSFAAMKHVGLNVAADPLLTLAYEGVNGGLIVMTGDDPGMHSSQNEQDNRYYSIFGKLVCIEPTDSQECKDYIKLAYEISEKNDLVVLFRMTTRVCHSKSIVELGERVEVGIRNYEKNVRKNIMTPANSKPRHVVVEDKFAELENYSNACPLNTIEYNSKKIGVITSGIAYQHSKDVFGTEASYLKIGLSNPLPKKMIAEFASQVEELYIIEENEPFIETQVRAMGITCKGKEVVPRCDELDNRKIGKAFGVERYVKEDLFQSALLVPPRPPVLCAGCPHRGFFYELAKHKDIMVAGDIGCYTLGAAKPLDTIDSIICMGGGFSGATGFDQANKLAGRKTKVFGCVGDSTFFHSGITSLIDAVYNQADAVYCILNNSITAMTGHQENPGTGRTISGEITEKIDIISVVRAVGVPEDHIRVVDPLNLEETRAAINEAKVSTGVFVIMTKSPCALIKEVQRANAGKHVTAVPDKCKSCRACLKLGCPAVSLNKQGK
ncbi:MAG: indolepyruvate ferredoxin oxidoreductase subunit alpha, partial [Lachnospiraceae bacterium]